MKKTYEAWIEDRDITFTLASNLCDLRQRGLLRPDAKFLHRIEADTFEEALAVHYLRLGKTAIPTSRRTCEVPQWLRCILLSEGKRRLSELRKYLLIRAACQWSSISRGFLKFH